MNREMTTPSTIASKEDIKPSAIVKQQNIIKKTQSNQRERFNFLLLNENYAMYVSKQI
jgi:hypothetical protein